MFHLFLIRSFISSISVSLVSLGVMSWSRRVLLFLDFHMDHIVIEIRVHSLSAPLLQSFLNDSAGDPLPSQVLEGGEDTSGC